MALQGPYTGDIHSQLALWVDTSKETSNGVLKFRIGSKLHVIQSCESPFASALCADVRMVK